MPTPPQSRPARCNPTTTSRLDGRCPGAQNDKVLSQPSPESGHPTATIPKPLCLRVSVLPSASKHRILTALNKTRLQADELLSPIQNPLRSLRLCGETQGSALGRRINHRRRANLQILIQNSELKTPNSAVSSGSGTWVGFRIPRPACHIYPEGRQRVRLTRPSPLCYDSPDHPASGHPPVGTAARRGDRCTTISTSYKKIFNI